MARQSRAPSILLTRPLPQSQRFAAELAVRWPDLPVMISPMMAPEYLRPALPEADFAAVILASETGAEAARRISATGIRLPELAFCVGDRTAAAATAAGLRAVSAQGAADDLVALILATKPSGPLLFLRGKDSVGDLENRLISAGIETYSAITYRQIQHPLSNPSIQLLQQAGPVVLPLFSPRSAHIFQTETRDLPMTAPLWIAALSPAVASLAADLAPDRMEIASHPNASAMLDSLARLLDQGMGS